MSALYRHECPGCEFQVDAWEGGDPYVCDDRGRRQYYYHPNEEERFKRILESCRWAEGKTPDELAELLRVKSGVMSGFLCLRCAKVFKCDEDKTTPVCRKCRSKEVLALWQLAGAQCPKCRQATFPGVPEMIGIS